MKIDIFGLNLRKKGVGKGHTQNEKQIKLAHYEYINCNWSLWQKNYNFANFGPKTEMCSNFYEIWHLEQIEHATCEYSTWNQWSCSKIIDSGKFGPKIEMCPSFHEIWQSGHF